MRDKGLAQVSKRGSFVVLGFELNPAENPRSLVSFFCQNTQRAGQTGRLSLPTGKNWQKRNRFEFGFFLKKMTTLRQLENIRRFSITFVSSKEAGKQMTSW